MSGVYDTFDDSAYSLRQSFAGAGGGENTANSESGWTVTGWLIFGSECATPGSQSPGSARNTGQNSDSPSSSETLDALIRCFSGDVCKATLCDCFGKQNWDPDYFA